MKLHTLQQQINTAVRHMRGLLFAVLCLSATVPAAGQTIHYVTPNGQADETSWSNTKTLEKALEDAQSGDEIWVQGFEQISNKSQLYMTTGNGFTLPAGVKLYGGFKGNETSINERQTSGKLSRMTYRSVLTGALQGDNEVDKTFLIFPENTQRNGNATHVLSIDLGDGKNTGSAPTVVNGFTITGGHADGTDEYGGGIFITNTTGQGVNYYQIKQCVFFNNYGTLGGAIYVDPNTLNNTNNNTSLISHCEFFNNAAGNRVALANSGGAIYLGGTGKVVNCSIFNNEQGGIRLSAGASVINSTVVRNTGGGIDAIVQTDRSATVSNTVIWGNTSLYSQYEPKFQHCAAHEFEEKENSQGNIYVSDKNNDNNQASPFFSSPSTRIGFDISFSWQKNAYPLWEWEPTLGSAFIDKGNDTFYDATDLQSSTDLTGDPRIVNTIDIGSYEYQQINEARIRYVRPVATGNGDGSSWEHASGNLQEMINELYDDGTKGAGEVWVAAGEYVPKHYLPGTELPNTQNSSNQYLSFYMRDGISVYGGFVGDETSLQDRQTKEDGLPWEFKHQTILRGYRSTGVDDSGLLSWNETTKRWTLSAGESAHVVWFAPEPEEDGMTIGSFKHTTRLDGVTIQGGNAPQIYATGGYRIGHGAGVYLAVNAELHNSIVRSNVAKGNGGGVYIAGGRVHTSLIYNNSADANGGGVYMENAGIVLRSAIVNNASLNGGGVYLDHTGNYLDGEPHPEYLILTTSVVSNNTATGNGAVYCNKGGVILQSTITNNHNPSPIDAANPDSPQTGGLYLNGYGQTINSIVWNNRFGTGNTSRHIPMFAKDPTTSTVRFYNTAVAGINNAVWNNTLQQDLLALADENNSSEEGEIYPQFEPDGKTFTSDELLLTTFGVQPDWREIDYFWKPARGSNLRARGMVLGNFPEEIVVSPELDLWGDLFFQKPALGVSEIQATNIQHIVIDSDIWRIYVDVECTNPEHNGISWANGYRSINEAIEYFVSHSNDPDAKDKTFEIYVLEGTIEPRFSFSDLDPKTATINILKMPGEQTLHLKGGFMRESDAEGDARPYNPTLYRSFIDGNVKANELADGLYHNIVVADGANAVIEGFHVINGYAEGNAKVKRGAGLLIGVDATVEVKDCIFENNTAAENAAIGLVDNANGSKLKLTNCVINNNTNTDETTPILPTENAVTLLHCTVVNNIGTSTTTGTNSFSAGNTSGNSLSDLAITSANFANPTNAPGATLGFDTYLGGYSNFRPLTSSVEAAGAIINKGTKVADPALDIAQNARDLGGIPDLGAYEAELPKSRNVIYVRVDGKGQEGFSWDDALNDINAAVRKAESIDLGTKEVTYIKKDGVATTKTVTIHPEVWVAAGTYKSDPSNREPACFIIKEGVNVYGAFPATGNPGMDDRKPLDETSEYQTILEPKTVVEGQITDYIDYASDETGGLNGIHSEKTTIYIRRVLAQENKYNPKRFKESDTNTETEYYWRKGFDTPTEWDGFTIQNGRIDLRSTTDDGGAGARIYENVTLKNCIIQKNKSTLTHINRNNSDASSTHKPDGRGGGVYSLGGTLINCYIRNNELGAWNNASGFWRENGAMYGGGIFCNYSTLYNCIIADNVIHGNFADGAGVCLEVGEFFNNTVVRNKVEGGKDRACGGLRVWVGETNTNEGQALIYNSIILENEGFGSLNGNENVAVSKDKGKISLFNCILDKTTGWGNAITLNECKAENSLKNIMDDNYQLTQSSAALNMGRNTFTTEKVIVPRPNSSNVDDMKPGEGLSNISYWSNYSYVTIDNDVNLFDYTDMDYTDRVKDCTVDAGAYERSNEDNIQDNNGVYYVTIPGNGLANGSSPENAACRMKLQEILYAAGERAALGETAIVKLAGYENATSGDTNTDNIYWANTLYDPNDPQSYTFVIPYGVTVMGGYTENFTEGDNRDAARYMTVLSPIAIKGGQTVNGYHAVTFGEPNPSTTAKTGATIIDGLYLEGGRATSQAGVGNSKTRGGGAIVPAYAHVRNCVVRNNEAIQGGGLYVLPGGLVTGCGVMENKADEGAGIYLDNDNAKDENRSLIVSSTLAANTASQIGGGIYLEDQAGCIINTVVWGNTAPSGKNVSGDLSTAFGNDLLRAIVSEAGGSNGGTEIADGKFYPFNNCYVETYEMPGNFLNYSMESDEALYFANYYRPKAYSVLINGGPITAFQTAGEEIIQVAKYDMQGIPRADESETRVDAGAYAYQGGNMKMPNNESEIVRRIFVSTGTRVSLTAGSDESDYLGRSFHTSLTHLDDALAYIKQVRELESGKYSDIPFEIWISQGTYKPTYRRTDANTETIDQRQNSFVIPDNVKLFGGFTGDENYAYGIETIPATGTANGITVENINDNSKVTAKLNARDLGDQNSNNLLEPWELANQTILSGKVNVSSTVKNVYHVLYSSATATTATGVTLDGLTVQDGETLNEIKITTSETGNHTSNEVGFGGGIYSNNVPYTLVRCRLLNNKAMRGGAIYVRNATLKLFGTILSGNGTVDNPIGTEEPRGGAVTVIATGGGNPQAALYAANTLWANNESEGYGGALSVYGNTTVNLINNTIVRNKAADYSALYRTGTTGTSTTTITNTVFWGNEGGSYLLPTDTKVTYSAAEIFTDNSDNNIQLNTENMAANGPRFRAPSDKAGLDGYSVTALWNPGAISVLTDGGDGYEPFNGAPTGTYEEWWGPGTANATDYKEIYISGVNRYIGPPTDHQNPSPNKPIDIGFYEYQYPQNLENRDVVYVATEDAGLGDGSSWENATSNFQGALSALSNPASTNTKGLKTIYVKAGEYTAPRVGDGGEVFSFSLNGESKFLTSLTILGSCTGSGDIQDFSKPSVITVNPNSAGKTQTLLNCTTNGKNLHIEGFTLLNDGTQNDNNEIGIKANTSGGGNLTLKNIATRNNSGTGIDISEGGTVLIANTLFADGGIGLKAGSNTTVVNATFANNGVDYDNSGTIPTIYNTVSWNENNTLTSSSDDGNVAIAQNIDNNDPQSGPNFVDPNNNDIAKRDYSIRPSMSLLDKGKDEKYKNTDGLNPDDRDLANNPRFSGTIDVGAYEFASELSEILYVKQGIAAGDGKSWDSPLSDLQSAVNLAGVYSSSQAGGDGTTKVGYVFVDREVITTDLKVPFANVKVYGGMNGETGKTPTEILSKRLGTLESDKHSTINGLSITADAVVDGFEVTGTTTVDAGVLSTSVVVTKNVTGTNGTLYNSLVDGTVSCPAVNVTATGSITNTLSINNRASATKNKYFNDEDGYWKYQLEESDNNNLDQAESSTITTYIDKVGHSCDLAGNSRIRRNVDNGCFETWLVTADQTVTDNDYPHGKTAVYVNASVELILDKEYTEINPFTPGFLLLKHRAGLRGNGQSIDLDNLAVERTVETGKVDLAYVPFIVTRVENPNDVSIQEYDGEKRAEYTFKFSETKSEAWESVTTPAEGVLLDNTTGTASASVRFYGNSYKEGNNEHKNITLTQHNHTNWGGASGERFTHKENMGWNLTGSPYLCAMNFSDMKYGRVIYTVADKTYKSLQTWNEETGVTVSGSLPAGDAFFTQTATLKTEESIPVEAPSAPADENTLRSGNLAIGISSALTRSTTEEDVIELTAVPTPEASYDFDIATDGVKWMSYAEEVPQIYIARDGGRYSLLSAVDEKGILDLGVRIGREGSYTIALPDDCPADAYDSVILQDLHAGKSVDLKNGGYTFSALRSGEVEGRFRLSFNGTVGEVLSEIQAYRKAPGKVVVEGLPEKAIVNWYDLSGQRLFSHPATNYREEYDLPGYVVILEVIDKEGKRLASLKVSVR